MLEDFTDNYEIIGTEVVNKKTKKIMPVNTTNKNSKIYKLKNNKGKWKQVTEKRVKAYLGDKLELPKDAVPLTMCGNGKEYFICTKGNIYSFSIAEPQGIILKPRIGPSGYLEVRLVYRGKRLTKGVHALMVEAFIMENYSDKNLVAMHLDDNKTNNVLSNLCLGTYSDNLKSAYKNNKRNKKQIPSESETEIM